MHRYASGQWSRVVSTGVPAISLRNDVPMLPIPGQAMIDRAVTKALLKLKGNGANLAVMIGEAQKTANFVGSTARQIAQAVRQLRRGRLEDGFLRLGANPHDWRRYPDKWLAFQYAVKPLVGEVYQACKMLSDKSSRFSDKVVTVKGVVKEENPIDILFGGLWARRVAGKQMRGVFVRLDYIPDHDVLAKLSETGITNPLLVAWELVPYSFVVDWFLPVGSWLETFDATLGFKFLSGSRTIRREVKLACESVDVSSTWDPAYHRWTSHSGDFSGSFHSLSLDRVVYGSTPRPWIPRMKNPLSLGHMANGLSLLAAAFR